MAMVRFLGFKKTDEIVNNLQKESTMRKRETRQRVRAPPPMRSDRQGRPRGWSLPGPACTRLCLAPRARAFVRPKSARTPTHTRLRPA